MCPWPKQCIFVQSELRFELRVQLKDLLSTMSQKQNSTSQIQHYSSANTTCEIPRNFSTPFSLSQYNTFRTQSISVESRALCSALWEDVDDLRRLFLVAGWGWLMPTSDICWLRSFNSSFCSQHTALLVADCIINAFTSSIHAFSSPEYQCDQF